MLYEDIVNFYQKYVMPVYAPELALAKGRGVYVWDVKGKRYLDFSSGIAVVGLGHCHEKVTLAITSQATRLVHVSNLYYNEKQAELARLLNSIAGGGKCFFCNSGAEANEAMIKLARLWGHDRGKYEIISMRNSFHGRTLATITATGQEKVQKGFEPLPSGFVYAEFNNLKSVEEKVGEHTVAVLVEAIQGEGGIIPAEKDFMMGLRHLCDEKEILLLCDEVQCGMGRTGRWFGFELYEIKPDAFSLAKALGNGFPIGSVVGYDRLADVFSPGKHASTFGGNPLACSAAIAVIETIQNENILKNVVVTGNYFKNALIKLASSYSLIKEVRGIGFMLGIVIDGDPKQLCRIMAAKGLLAIPTGQTVVRFLPPLIAEKNHVDEALCIMEESLKEFIKSKEEKKC